MKVGGSLAGVAGCEWKRGDLPASVREMGRFGGGSWVDIGQDRGGWKGLGQGKWNWQLWLTGDALVEPRYCMSFIVRDAYMNYYS